MTPERMNVNHEGTKKAMKNRKSLRALRFFMADFRKRRENMRIGKVLLVELNEVTWDLIDPLIERGKLPTFARLKSEGAWAAPLSVDRPPHLDPWITWTTV